MAIIEYTPACAHPRKSPRLYLRPNLQAWLACDDCHEPLEYLPRATADARATAGKRASSYALPRVA